MSIAVRDAVAVGDHQRRARRRPRPRGTPSASAAGRRPSRPGPRTRCRRPSPAGQGPWWHRLPAGGELRHRAERGRLRHLPAGVGVDLGVEHQHVHVSSRCKHVIQSAGADIVRPAVAADDPDAAPQQVVDDAAADRATAARRPRRVAARARRPAALRAELRFVVAAARRGSPSTSSAPIRVAELSPGSRAASSVWRSAASRSPRPNSALSSNSEFDHAGPLPVGVRPSTASSAGCRRRSTSSRSRWRSSAGRRTAARAA